jgi:hypothetical protein
MNRRPLTSFVLNEEFDESNRETSDLIVQDFAVFLERFNGVWQHSIMNLNFLVLNLEKTIEFLVEKC